MNKKFEDGTQSICPKWVFIKPKHLEKFLEESEVMLWSLLKTQGLGPVPKGAPRCGGKVCPWGQVVSSFPLMQSGLVLERLVFHLIYAWVMIVTSEFLGRLNKRRKILDLRHP